MGYWDSITGRHVEQRTSDAQPPSTQYPEKSQSRVRSRDRTPQGDLSETLAFIAQQSIMRPTLSVRVV